jgi:hypothetical protein
MVCQYRQIEIATATLQHGAEHLQRIAGRMPRGDAP